ncbi:MAG: hypothetical protein HRF40_10565 [Nitrososphaera sp.]
MVDGSMVGLAHSLAILTYTTGVLMQTLPVPWKSIRAYGPLLMWDGVISEMATLSIGLVQTLVIWVQNIVQQSIGAPLTGSGTEMALIVAQLTALDAGLFLLISTLSTTVVLAPAASALSSMFGPLLTWVTVALIVWLIVQTILGFLPTLWLTFYTLGVVFLAIPFRLGRRFGTSLMATSIVLMVMLPLMPSLAIWLEGQLGYQTAIKPVEDILQKSKTKPENLLKLIPQLPLSVAGLMVSVVVALVIFPFAYFFIISMVVRSLASMLGSNASGPSVSSFVLTPAWETGGRLTK